MGKLKNESAVLFEKIEGNTLRWKTCRRRKSGVKTDRTQRRWRCGLDAVGSASHATAV